MGGRDMATILLAPTLLTLVPGSGNTILVGGLPAQTDAVIVRMRRPTSTAPLAWDTTTRLRISIVLDADGQEYRCVSEASGGIRIRRDGTDIPESRLLYRPTWGFWGRRSGLPKRLGETTQSHYEMRVVIEMLSGSAAQTEITVESTESPAPPVPFHSSVAFDAATSAQENAGDGVISLSHTAAGLERAAFVGVGNSSGTGGALGSTTYDGSAMTEHWDAVYGSFSAHAGYSKVAVALGTRTVVNTLVSAPEEHVVGVISMTEVDQLVPVGTPVTATGATSPATVTVGAVGGDDLIVSNLYSGWNGATPGADQIERWEQIAGSPSFETSGSGDTQPGSAGGVMSKTQTAVGSSTEWGIGAIAFKPAVPSSPVVSADYSIFPPVQDLGKCRCCS